MFAAKQVWRQPSIVALAVFILGFAAARASALDVRCDAPGADSMGRAIATGGDLDGDGVGDIAISSPCATAGSLKLAGRVDVFSSQTGTRIRTYKGTKSQQKFGAAVAFYRDRDADGGDELVVTSFSWDTATATDAGKVEIVDYDGNVLLAVEGPTDGANFGESLAIVPDTDADGFAELLVGAGNDLEGSERRGRAYLLSGADGTEMDSSTGALKYDNWGSTVTAAPDITGDSVPDVVVASNLADVASIVTETGQCATNADCTLQGASCEATGETVDGQPVFRCSVTVQTENNGVVQLLSGADMSAVAMAVSGATNERLGTSVVPHAYDGFYSGAPGTKVAGLNKAGTVTHFSWGGEVLETITEPVPAVTANFGTAIAVPGDLDADGIDDIVISAPERTLSGVGPVGSVYAFSGVSHELLWTLVGDRKLLRLGATLTSAPDMDADGVPDVFVSAPGDVSFGRRFAGTVRLISGADGSEIRRFRGRRGFETRFFVAGRATGLGGRVLSFDRKGKRRELAQEPFRGLSSGDLSVAVLDAGVEVAGPTDLKLVIGTGHKGADDRVRLVRAGRREVVEYELQGFDGKFPGGVSVAAGDVTGDTDEDVVVVQADTPDGIVRARVFDRLDPDPSGKVDWPAVAQFRVFADASSALRQGAVPASNLSTADATPGVTSGFATAVKADGANVAVGNVIVGPAPDKAEIVVGPISGAPVVRILDGSGVVKAEWFAYSPRENSGTSVAVGDLNGDGVPEIVTAPSKGQPWVRAFKPDGSAFKLGGTAVSFFAYDSSFTAGLRVAVADVDLDGRGEILVAPAAGPVCVVKAFEVDGTPVSGWRDVTPFGPACAGGLSLAGTDRFLHY